MKSPSHFLKCKLKNAKETNNTNSNFQINVNYVSNILNNMESTLRQNINNYAEKENIFLDKEISPLTNFKFMQSSRIRNNLSNFSSSIKNTNSNKKKKSCCSSMNILNSNNEECFNSNFLNSKRENYLDIINNNFSKISKTPKVSNNFSKISKTPKASNINSFKEKSGNTKGSLFMNFAKDYAKSPKCRQTVVINPMMVDKNMNQINNFNNNEKLFKINENIQNELDSKELKKKITLMKKSLIQNNSSKELKILLNEEKINSKLKKTDIKKSKNKISKISDNNDNNDDNEIPQKNQQDNSKVSIEEKSFINKNYEKFRKLKRVKEIYDSFDDEEYEEDNENYYISPSSYFIKVFDCFMFISCMFYLIYAPHYFSTNIILKGENKPALVILTFIDFIYILDIIINFFRAYQNFDENLVRKTKFIFLHYLKTWFLFDFIQAIPFYTFFKFMERECINYGICSLEGYSFIKVDPILYLIILVKILKVYKMIKENNTISSFVGILSENEFIDNYGYILFSVFYSLCFLNLCSCLYIFIGKNSFPGWIVKIQIIDEPYINIYVASVYFIVVTITTVGYGDITGNSYAEIAFQMFLLIIGTLAYSFVISYISNYIIKKNQKSLTFEKNMNILKEIKMHNPHLKDSLYQECIKNLLNEQLYERKDKSLLFDCLPYSLKNKLIMEMYKPFIKNFVFFKYIENSDFIVKVVTSLKPLLSFKGNILIQEGDFVKEIFFVKKGGLSLNITIDKEYIEESLGKYIDINDFGIIKIAYMKPLILKTYTTLNLDNYLNKNKKENKINIQNNINIQDIKIIEIRKNEHFGVALMFLNERSPLVVKVKTKIAELLVLRKMEAIEIYSIYPNIWNRINKKSLFNMEQIKEKMKKEIFSLAQKYGSETERNILKTSKSLNRFMSLKSLNQNIDNSQIKDDNNDIKKSKYKNHKKNKYNTNIEVIEEKDENSPTKIQENINEETIENDKKEREYIIDKKDISNSHINNNNNQIININSNNNNTKKDIINELEKPLILETQNKIDNKSDIGNEESTNSKKNDNKKNFLKSFSSDSFSSKPIEKENILNIKKEYKKIEENQNKNLKKKIVKHWSMPLNLDFNKDNKSSNKPKCSTISIPVKSIGNKSEHLFYQTFTNLTTCNEKSFELISSYENINKITNNIYMKNTVLQSKTKQFLIKECSSISNDSVNEKVLICKNPLNGKVKINKNDIIRRLTDDYKKEDDNKSVNSLDLSKLKSNRNNEKLEDLSYKDITQIKAKRHESTKNLFEKNQSKYNIIEMINKNQTRTIRKRRKPEFVNVNKKLDMITKNIKGANKNINNPDEFYIDFFNNIIKKETGVLDKSIDKDNNYNNHKKVSNDSSPKKKTLNCSEKNSPANKKSHLNSIISSDDTKIKKLKIQKK